LNDIERNHNSYPALGQAWKQLGTDQPAERSDGAAQFFRCLPSRQQHAHPLTYEMRYLIRDRRYALEDALVNASWSLLDFLTGTAEAVRSIGSNR
jgi:hypothetical protein